MAVAAAAAAMEDHEHLPTVFPSLASNTVTTSAELTEALAPPYDGSPFSHLVVRMLEHNSQGNNEGELWARLGNPEWMVAPARHIKTLDIVRLPPVQQMDTDIQGIAPRFPNLQVLTIEFTLPLVGSTYAALASLIRNCAALRTFTVVTQDRRIEAKWLAPFHTALRARNGALPTVRIINADSRLVLFADTDREEPGAAARRASQGVLGGGGGNSNPPQRGWNVSS